MQINVIVNVHIRYFIKAPLMLVHDNRIINLSINIEIHKLVVNLGLFQIQHY